MGVLRNTCGHVARYLGRATLVSLLVVVSSNAQAQQQMERLPELSESGVLDEQEYTAMPRVVLEPSSRPCRSDVWSYQVLPEGLLYKSYLAGVKEPRFAGQWVHEKGQGWIWDLTLGGRVGIIRHGNEDPLHPEGWQFDMEGAALPRLDFGDRMDLVACDYRFGLLMTHARGRHHTKCGYYHLSSHLGDEYMLRYPDAVRINYVRDSIILGHAVYVTDDVRLYAETSWAFSANDGAEPWEFQFGAEYSPACPTGLRPVPFMAINGHLREELDYGGNVVVQSGLQWRGDTGHLLRVGVHTYVGMSDQQEFYNEYESKVGMGIWYDY